MSEATAAGLLRIKGALLDARRELIDLSRRNRLLNASRTGPRPHCLEIVNADPDAVFIGLARAGKPFGFAALADSAEFSLEAPESQRESSSRARLDRLQTRLPVQALERRLVKFFREARTFEEEQGINILFLALGFLHWFEDDRAQERCSAPLLLVPVMLERRQGRDSFVLRGRDDDVSINISLAEKLRSFGIALPDLSENEDWLPTSYMNAVANAVAPPRAIENRAGTPLGQRRWEVERDGIGLGFFTFSKFLMWRQLDPGAWPDERLLVEHDLVARLLGEGPPGEPEPPLVPDDEPIDRHIDLAGAVHVLDADSSQALCIREALDGHNLVIQGPPGTGKSQTIANLIAGAAHDGKSVLFVAEKAAALDVVHGRLKTAGLEPLCLEIHSKKAAKLSVVAALERALQAAAAIPGDGRTEAELRAARDRLNGWSAALHREIRRSGRTPYQVIGTVLKLRAIGTRTPDQRLDSAADWDRDQLMEAERAVAQAAAAVERLRCIPPHHPWYGTQGDRLTPFDLDRLREAITKVREELGALITTGGAAAALLEAREDLSGAVLRDCISALRILARAPEPGRAALSHSAWRGERPRIGALLEHGKLYAVSRAELADCLTEAAWTADVASLRRVIAAHGRSWLRCFNRAYRDAVAALRALCRAPPPRRLEARLALLDKIVATQSARRGLEQEEEFGRAVLGSLWAAADSDWAAAEALLDWAEEAARSALPADLLALAPAVAPACCAALAEELESALGVFSAGFAKLAAIVRPDLGRVFGNEDIDRVSLAALADKLDAWVRTVEGFNDWVAGREALALLRQWGLASIADGIEAGTVRPGEATPMAELLIAEALWRAGCGDDPTLDQIDGELRGETVLRFRELDRERIALARLEVLARYCAQRPNGQAGEMGIVRAEIGKKRRHLPIRRLMEVAGPAIQRLKPIFLMSPLSVAHYLPPGRLSFDLVVIDEASQVPPEEAIGVIARGRQVVVVGDDKQLPPTNFFRMVAGEDEAEEAAANAMPIARPRDFESILTLARARGHAERMLRWHYRSRHPSLIALSNQTCYGGGLLLPPSPCPNGEGLGLSLVRTPRGHYERGGSGRNPAEAELIAGAVERHLSTHPKRSLGVACFSVAQRDAIEDALQARGLSAAVEGFAPKGERLFVKNLEAVQGDERDTILISIGYGPDAEGRMTAGFGPLSAEGGERRLNVLISRARLQCVVFSSITAGDIPADARPQGTRMLREFLHFAETGHLAAGRVGSAGFDSPFEEAVALVIRGAGYEVVPQVGVSGFRIDLGVLSPREPGRFILGVECDGAAYHSGRSARDRDRLRQEVLEGLGWTLYRIWSTDWFRRPEREKERLLAAIENAATAARSPSVETKMPPPEVVVPAAVPPQKADAGPARAAPYRECALSVPRGAPLLALDRAGLAELASAVVREEGPIHVEEVARRIREAFGLERTGRRILAAVGAALHAAGESGTLVRDGEFWSQAGRGLTRPRSRRAAAAPLRRADRIAPCEYQLAIRAVLDQCVGAAKPELVVAVAHLLGFERTGNGLDRAISEQIDAMIAAGELTGAADSIRIADKLNNETVRQ